MPEFPEFSNCPFFQNFTLDLIMVVPVIKYNEIQIIISEIIRKRGES